MEEGEEILFFFLKLYFSTLELLNKFRLRKALVSAPLNVIVDYLK